MIVIKSREDRTLVEGKESVRGSVEEMKGK